ncbi:hypothetical protein ACLZRP_09730 [Klebsiella pneumoniae]|uniref:hypothetical protein n=1 Tax=Klebsiella pneumoniae TaxID=573 RepID=UPI001B317A39|nr:hypothetical protein [Klebsiella pneumoniae]EMC8232223.1 hypothetical protein [Klebsiella pneumoniae]MBP3096601.1 hypothetical protein [Klebsiella pneumoniae]MCE0259908.1 hypothetical protein [Klebsiella pneumoniae]MDG0528589.1 hypothetical protein [Klebsiella pneumoniae]MDP1480312.1 hypothetical protein [Klebsiella pneumoniae]
MNIETVNELIASLESAGELSIREQKFLKLAKAYQQLAAENVGLRPLIAENWNMRDLLRQLMAGRPGGVYFNKWEKLIVGVLNETPATDRIVAGIKADGVEMFALMFAEEAIKDNNITTGWKARASRAASEYAELLREGAK